MTRLFFIHIPRTGGTTVADALERQYKVTRVHGDLLSIKEMTWEQRQKAEIVAGHMPFGLHEWFPGESTYFTMLRHPIDRIVSHYYYVMGSKTHPLRQKAIGKGLVKYPWLSPELNNGMTRMLSGRLDHLYSDGPCPVALLEEAMDNLEDHFAGVGFTERFDDSMVKLGKILGQRLEYEPQNVNPHRPPENIPVGILDAIREANRLDMMLYEFARECMCRTR